jgi:hypothetical protein
MKYFHFYEMNWHVVPVNFGVVWDYKISRINTLNPKPVFFLFITMGWDDISELRPPAGLLFIPQMIYVYDGPRWHEIDRGKNEELGEKPVPVPLCQPQIPRGLTWARTRAFEQILVYAMLPSEPRYQKYTETPPLTVFDWSLFVVIDRGLLDYEDPRSWNVLWEVLHSATK